MIVTMLRRIAARCARAWPSGSAWPCAARQVMERSAACRTPADHVDLISEFFQFRMYQSRGEITGLMTLVSTSGPTGPWRSAAPAGRSISSRGPASLEPASSRWIGRFPRPVGGLPRVRRPGADARMPCRATRTRRRLATG